MRCWSRQCNRRIAVLCLGDFNAEMGLAWNPPSVVGPYEYGIVNDNSQWLLDFCVSANLRICGSWYCRKNINWFTWLSNDHKTAKEIDHVLVNRRWNVIKNCRAYRNLEFNTDHRPVIATCCLKLKKQPAISLLNKRYNMSKLLLPDVQYQYQVAIQNRFSALADRSGEWDVFKDIIPKLPRKCSGSANMPSTSGLATQPGIW